MDSVTSNIINVRDYPTLFRVFAVWTYHGNHNPHMFRIMKRVYYLNHTLDMEYLYERYKK